MSEEVFKVLMTLEGIWPIPITRPIGPIQIEEGISLVFIAGSDQEHPTNDQRNDFTVRMYDKGEIVVRYSLYEHPLSSLPKMGLLFELENRGRIYFPHRYVARSMRPKTLLRLYQSGEFIASLLINELGFDVCTPTNRNPDLISYDIENKTVEPLTNFCKYFLGIWNEAEKNINSRKGSATFEELRLRLNNAVQFLDKSYLDEFSFRRSIAPRESDKLRHDNYLRLLFCWLGIESLVCYGEDEKVAELKENISLIFTGFERDKIDELVTTYYKKRSGYVHADPSKMYAILNKDLNVVRDVLKRLIMIYFVVCSDDRGLRELGKAPGINPVKGMIKMDLTEYFNEVHNNSGANFSSYSFNPAKQFVPPIPVSPQPPGVNLLPASPPPNPLSRSPKPKNRRCKKNI